MRRINLSLAHNLGSVLVVLLIITRGVLAVESVPESAKADPKALRLRHLSTMKMILEHPEKPVNWEATYKAALSLFQLQDPEVNDLSLKYLERKMPISLNPYTGLPQAMAPLHMLQSLAIQNLAATGDRKYIAVFKAIAKESPERVLVMMAKEDARRLEEKGMRPEAGNK